MPEQPKAAQVFIDTQRIIGDISPLLWGGFAEHMGRCIYEGIYEPGSPHADEHGFRHDVIQALRELNFRVMRYPGGNFLSGYNWLDGVGPREQRPRKRDMAWKSIETNQFGTDEFMTFCRSVNTLPMMAVNLGTGTIQSAADLVEYCNAPVGTYYADLRAANGQRDPYDVRYWCLGNEMDGPWQIGHMEAHEYARKALEAAKMMKWHDPAIELILCGSSSTHMPTYPEWDRTVLEACWERVEYLSMHYYAANRDDDTARYLGLAWQFEQHVDALAATLRYVKAKQRSQHDVYLAWDEWNVSHPHGGDGREDWTEAPHIAELTYNLEDALVVAQWLNVFLRRCDVLKIACLAQIVNVLGPILTQDDRMIRQTIFYPLMLFSRYAAGKSLDVLAQSPRYETQLGEVLPDHLSHEQHDLLGEMPLLDASASFDEASGAGAVFLVNRSQTDALETTLRWQNDVPQRISEIHRVAGNDPKAVNTFDQPNTIGVHTEAGMPIEDGSVTVSLPPLSCTVLVTV